MRFPALFGLATSLSLSLASSTPAQAAWPTYGDTLYRYYQGSPGAQIVTDGAGGVFVGLHVILSASDYLFPFHFAADGTRIGTWGQSVFGNHDFALDGSGGLYAAEYQNPSTHDLWIEHWTAAGVLDPSWSSGKTRVVDGSLGLGTAHEVTTASDDSGGVYVTCAIGAPLLAWRVLPDGSLAGGWPPEGAPVRDVFGEAEDFHATIPDGAGGIVSGMESITGGGTPYSMRAVRMRPNGTRRWSVLATGDHVSGGSMVGLIHADGDHVFYCWASDTLPAVRQIRLQCLRVTNGARVPTWPSNGVLITQAPPDSLEARLLSDGGADAYVVWSRPGSIRAVRIDSTGTLVTGWPATGNSLVDAGAVFGPTAVPPTSTASASAHGLMYVWSDARDSGSMRARWLLPNGLADPGYPDAGALLPTTPHGFALASYQGDGAYVVAEDQSWPNQSEYNTYLLNPINVTPTAVAPPSSMRGAVLRIAAYPNPASRELSLTLTLPDATPARAELLDVAGHRVRTLELAGAGARTARFDRLDALPSGVYFVRVSQHGTSATTRVALVH